jgi:alpha-L-arabinofuranosidase
MASYAPLMVNLNAPSWSTNLIGYDALNSYGSPSYYVQKLFSLYHGDVVLPTQLSGGDGKLYFVTSKMSSNGTIYLKVVNISSEAANVQIKINGVTTIDKQGTATVLTSGSANDMNSLTNPTKVIPVVDQLNSLSPSFFYSFAPNSVTVLQFIAH